MRLPTKLSRKKEKLWEVNNNINPKQPKRPNNNWLIALIITIILILGLFLDRDIIGYGFTIPNGSSVPFFEYNSRLPMELNSNPAWAALGAILPLSIIIWVYKSSVTWDTAYAMLKVYFKLAIATTIMANAGQIVLLFREFAWLVINILNIITQLNTLGLLMLMLVVFLFICIYKLIYVDN